MDKAWLDFWTFALIFAGASFAGITIVVAIRGGAELLRLFRRDSRHMPK